MLGSWAEQPVALGSSGFISVAFDDEYKEGHVWVEGSRTFLSSLPSLVPSLLAQDSPSLSMGFSGTCSPALPVVQLRPGI